MALLDSFARPSVDRPATRRRFCRAMCFALMLGAVLLSHQRVFAQAAEYRIKAVFLFNFAQFVEWPSSSLSEPGSPLVIGILGADPFGRFLDETVRNEQVNGHPLQVVRYRSVEEITTCHILFISQSEASRVPVILSALKGKPILTVSDMEDFARLGGMVRFLMENKKVRFRINVGAAEDAGLAISSKLLRVAEIVRTEKEN